MKSSRIKSERYSKVYRAVWSDDRFLALSSAPPNAQTLWLYVLTGHHVTSVPGLWRFSIASTSEFLRWPSDDTLRCFDELVAAGMVRYDRRALTLWLPNAYRYSKPNAASVVDGWREPLAELPSSAIKAEALSTIGQWLEEVGPTFAQAFRRACGELPPPRSPNPSGLPRARATGSTTGSATGSGTDAGSAELEKSSQHRKYVSVNTTDSAAASGVAKRPKTTVSGTATATDSTTDSGDDFAPTSLASSAGQSSSNRAVSAESTTGTHRRVGPKTTTASTTVSATASTTASTTEGEGEVFPPQPPVGVASAAAGPAGARRGSTQQTSAPGRGGAFSARQTSGRPDGALGGSPGSATAPSATAGHAANYGILPTDPSQSRAEFAVQVVHTLTRGRIGNVLSDTDLKLLDARIRTLQSREGSSLQPDCFVVFSKWLLEGGADGSGGLSWSHITPTWQWLLKDRRLETHLSESQAWWSAKNAPVTKPLLIVEDTIEEEERLARERKASVIASACSPLFVAMRNKGKKVEDRLVVLSREEAVRRMSSIFGKEEAERRVGEIFDDLKRREASV